MRSMIAVKLTRTVVNGLNTKWTFLHCFCSCDMQPLRPIQALSEMVASKSLHTIEPLHKGLLGENASASWPLGACSSLLCHICFSALSSLREVTEP